jgi:GR25 family glycosyltransferase involved in LPS biosynthesis
MKKFVISLKSTPGRLQTFTSRNADHDDIEVFDAIDGKTVEITASADGAISNNDLDYTSSAIGCALSHRALWKHAIALDESITICEDDVVLHRDFSDQARRLIEFVGRDWDLILWGWNFDAPLVAEISPNLSPCAMQFDQQSLRANWRSYITTPIAPSALKLWSAFGIPCYSISPNGAKKFLSNSFPLKNFVWTVPCFGYGVSNYGIDVAMCSIYRQTDSFVCFPPLAVTENDHAISTIQS